MTKMRPRIPFLHQKFAPPLIAAIVITVIGILLYANTLQVPFLFDDTQNIENNHYLRLTAITPVQIMRISNSPSPRPFANFTFALNYYFHQYRLPGYHAVNILIHIITAFLVFLVAGQTLRLSRTDIAWPVPLMAALLWMVHPLHTQSVTYIVQRMNSLATLFYLLALLCYITVRQQLQTRNKNKWRTVSFLSITIILSASLGLASKEITATLPLALFFYEWFFFQNLNARWLKNNLTWIILAIVAPLIVTIICLDIAPLEIIRTYYKNQSFTLGQRLATEPLVIIYYLSLIIFPHPSRLNLDHDFPLSTGIFSPPATALCILALLALLTTVIYSCKTHRMIAFALLWFLLTLLIESSVIGLALIFEHRTYLPSIFLIVTISWLILYSLKPRQLAWGFLLTAIFLCGIGTLQRNSLWSETTCFWQDCIKKSPEKERPYINLGAALKKKGAPQQAIPFYHQALRLNPQSTKARDELGAAYIQIGLPQKALPHLQTALKTDPGDYRPYITMGIAFLRRNQPRQALSYFQQALALGPAAPEIYVNMGTALQHLGKTKEALSYYKRALETGPYAKAYNNLGNLYFEKGQLDKARLYLQKALALNPDYKVARNNFNKLQKIITHHRQTIEQLEHQMQSQPVSLALLYQLSNLYTATGEYARAAEVYERLALRQPDNKTVFYNLACLYAIRNKTEKALLYLQKAVEKGYTDWSHMKQDPDLENIRKTVGFKKIIEKQG